MRKSRLYFLDIPFEERLKNIVKNYGIYSKQELEDCVLKIKKRLGGLNTKNSIQAITEGNLHEAFYILLKYYDKMYAQSLENREDFDSLLIKISCEDTQIKNATFLLER